MKKISVYGKGGIGKSTTVSNLSAAISKLGYKVMQIGCDPKADSTKNLMGGVFIPSVLDVMKEKGDSLELTDIVFQGFNGVLCVEAGGQSPGVGCAGRGIIAAFEKLEQLKAFEVYKPDVVIYDVLGDVVCGGFSMPIRNGYAQDIYIVTSGEMMSMYAANNISRAINQFKSKGYASLKGLILNAKNIENEVYLVEKLCEEIKSEIFKYIPKDKTVQESENRGKTVIEYDCESSMVNVYFDLAKKILNDNEKVEENVI